MKFYAEHSMKNTNNSVSLKTVLIAAGASTAYHIGSGFASGQEVMQFFGSWGSFWPLIVPLISGIILTVYCCRGYQAGSDEQFENPSIAYEFYCGKYVAKFMDIFSIIMIACTGVVMFAGCGSAIHQYLGTPVWVGAVVLGVVSIFVVCLGLEKVAQVLGCMGIVIIAAIIFIGIVTMAKMGFNVADAQKHVLEYVDQGKVLQAGLFGIYNPVLSGFFYGGNLVCMSFPFIVSLGKSMKNKKEAVASGIVSGLMLTAGIYFVLYIVLMNLDYIVATDAQILTIACVDQVMPIMRLPFTIVIVLGIFTTITGYLWIIGRRFAPDGTAKQRIIVIATTLVGILLGSVLPFGTLINILYPFVGVVGIILFVIILVSSSKRRNENV